MVVRFFAATLLVALLLVVCQVPNTLGASCPGEQSGVYNISVYTWPNADGSSSAGVGVGMYYEESADLVWALYNAFALAAFNTSKLMAGEQPAWNAAYFISNVQTGDLYNVQNLVVDSVRDKIIISKDTGVLIFRKSTFLSYGVSGNDAALETLQSFSIADAECRGIALDTIMNDGSFWVACQQNIYKFASDTTGTPLYTFYRADQVSASTKLWALTVDVANRKLWASVDNANDYNFYQFNILSDNLEYSTNLVMGAESRGLVYDPEFEELYAVKRPSAGLVRTKAYNPGFAFGLYNDYPFNRPNGMVAVRSRKTIFISDTPFRTGPDGPYYNFIWIYKYQHAGCQCRSDSECDSGQTCHVGICVTSTCSACQVGTPDGSCVGSTCISTSNSTSFDSQVTFDGPAPHHVLTPDQDPTKGLNVLFESLEEIPPQGGIPIQALVLLNQVYTIEGPTADKFSSENFDVSTSTPKGDITFHFSLLNATHDANRTFGSVAFSQNANSIKWTVDISGWPFLNTANTLLLRVRLLSEDGAFLSATKIASGGAIDTWELKTRNTAITVNLFNFAMADGNAEVGITSQFLTDDTVLLLSFPSFSSNITYDPDLGVVVTPSDSGDGGDNSVLVIVLAVVIPVVVVPILLLIAILIAVYLYTYFRRKSLRHRRDSVNTASFEYAAESAASGSM